MPLRIDQVLEIDAPTELVWSVLTDFNAYGEWNPFVVSASCSLVVGEPMDMRVRVLPFMTQPQREWITSCDEGKGFCYAMAMEPGRLLRSKRCHEVTSLGPGRTRYESRFAIEGPLSALVAGLVGGRLRLGFSEMSNGVKARAEWLATDASA